MRSTTLLRIILAIQGLIVRAAHFSTTGVIVDVGLTWKIPRCGECGNLCRGKPHHGRLRSWRHLDLAGMTVHLRYAIRRVFCASCDGVKTEEVPWAEGSFWFTRAFEERLAFLAQQCSQTMVSSMMRVAWRTVGKVIGRVVDREIGHRGDRFDGLTHIGIDELSYRKHHKYVTTVVDHEGGVIVWCRTGKNAATLKAFFEQLGPERCALIKSVTIDMSAAYISVVQEMVPNAQLIFDRFHVQRLVQDALDETRRDEVREASTKAEKKELKGTRKPLLKSPWNLTDSDVLTLDQLAEANENLFYGHLLKDSFGAILDRRQINVARTCLTQWILDAKESGLARFVRVAGTVEKHIDGILEYVRSGHSNARTEGLNGKIRTITRRAYGFHSAQSLISMIFLCCGGVHVTPAFSVPSPAT